MREVARELVPSCDDLVILYLTAVHLWLGTPPGNGVVGRRGHGVERIKSTLRTTFGDPPGGVDRSGARLSNLQLEHRPIADVDQRLSARP